MPVRKSCCIDFLKCNYSLRKDLTGFANAAAIAWKLIVSIAMLQAANAATAKIHQLIEIL